MSRQSVELRFTDAETRTIVVMHSETILEAALRQEIPLIHQCRSGSCSTCAGRVAIGQAEMTQGSALSLIPSEIKDGIRLLCRTQALSDCVVEMDYPFSQLCEAPPQTVAATVDETVWLSDSVVRLTLHLPRRSDVTFAAGQFFRLQVPDSDAWRSYSPASTPKQLPQLDFLIRVLPQGAMSDALRRGLEPGGTMHVEGPFGSFRLQDDGAAKRLLIAGGTGLAPILSMLDSIRQAPGPKRPVLLSFGCSSAAGFFYRDELELREAWMPNLTLLLSADQVADDDRLLAGTPLSVLPDGAVTADSVAYLCGPPGMIEAARQRLVGLGLSRENIRSESFTPSG